MNNKQGLYSIFNFIKMKLRQFSSRLLLAYFLLKYFFFLQMDDILKIHEDRCPSFCKDVQVSSDGVSENKSSINVLDVFSVRFHGCRIIYPCQIVRPIGKFKVNQRQLLDDFLTNVCSANCIIKKYIGDSLKRSNAKDCLGHSSYFPCEYCFCKGTLHHKCESSLVKKKKQLIESQTQIQSQIDALNDNDTSGSDNEMEELITQLQNVKKTLKDMNKSRGHIVWPKSSFGSEPKTPEKVLAIANKVVNNDKMSKDECKGIIGISLFFEIPYFHFVDDMPAEYLHSVCLGVSRKMLELTFNVGDNRARNTQRKLSSPVQFNILISLVLVPFEFSRRTRSLDFNVMKGQEFRNITIFFFSIVIECIEENAEERRLWLLYAFMIRSCVIPNDEFNEIANETIISCCEKFYTLYESLFTVANCTYYTHVVGSHLLEVRGDDPLTFNSAFGFESFYGEVRNSFVPGTCSPLKQILSKVLLKRTIGPHCCQTPIKYSKTNTEMERNNLIYTFGNSKYNIYKIIEKYDNYVQCEEILTTTKTFKEATDLQWSKVGVFNEGNVGDFKQIQIDNIHGKVIKIDKLLITCPINILREK